MSLRNSLAGAVGLCAVCLAPAAWAQIAINEILFDPMGVNTGRQVVEVANVGDSAVSMGSAGFWLYFPPARWQFPPGVTIPPGGTVRVHINRPGQATATELFTGISGMRNLKSSQGDALSLFRTNLFGDPAQILDFVQWGAPGNAGEDVASAAGIWTQGAFVDLGRLREGSSIAYDGAGDSPEDWCVDGTPSLGAPNDECTPSFARSPVVLNEVGYLRTGPGEYHPVVELKNPGGLLEDLGGKWISLKDQHSYQFPSGTPDTLLGQGEICLVHLGVDGTNGQFHFYTGRGTFRDLQSSDAVSFHSGKPFTDPTTVLDFVQWGSVGSPFEDAAAQAGLWTQGEFVNAADRRARGSIASRGEGAGAARWVVDNTGTPGLENDVPPLVPVVINEALVEPLGTTAGRTEVELHNLLEGEVVELGGYRLCLESAVTPGTLRCYALPAAARIPAQGFLVVHLNRFGVNSAAHVYTGALQDLDPASDSLFLFVSQGTSDPNNLIDYLRWGPDSSFNEGLAVTAGIWPPGGSVSVASIRDSSSIAYVGSGDDPASYRIDDTPSMGQDNDEISREQPFRRGDCNDNGKADISDAIFLLNFLFAGGVEGLCADACDVNGDEVRDISDPVNLLNHLFGGGPEPPAPVPTGACGTEADPGTLSCNSYLSCL
ncbi:MAG: lamin tail domain-containing protein [Planctomycetes bacterium]|nr:lamin tail domain-containing protein [Planctomycetota bacterium]